MMQCPTEYIHRSANFEKHGRQIVTVFMVSATPSIRHGVAVFGLKCRVTKICILKVGKIKHIH